MWEGSPDTCDGDPADRCATIATQHNQVIMMEEILGVQYDACTGRNIVVARFLENESCGTVNYPCGDIRKGGLDPDGPMEKWVGAICEVYDLGDNTFEFHLDASTGSNNFALQAGPTDDTYVWWQCCDPDYGPLCNWWQ